MKHGAWQRLWEGLALTALAAFLWIFRSWNLEIGDGLFCCKQTIGESVFEITLSRAPLAHLLYRVLFFTLHPILGWWVEDIIALSSCAAGLVFYWTLYRLVWKTTEDTRLRFLSLFFPASSMILNVFCGHVEFYSWTVALLMVGAYWSWRCIHEGMSPFWPSAAMALGAGFHSSGIFYFPALLALPVFYRAHNSGAFNMRNGLTAGLFFLLFIVSVFLHRAAATFSNGDLFRLGLLFTNPMDYVFAQTSLLIYGLLFGVGVWTYRNHVPEEWKDYLRPWWWMFLPWFVLFFLRAYFGLRSEPLTEHLPPLGEPYDHGAYLYKAFSWEHLYDKSMFHLWLAPFGFLGFIYFSSRYFRAIVADGWLYFLFQYSLWALVWSTLFYPQLRTRDWDLFVTMAVPLNLFVLYALHRFCSRRFVQSALMAMIFVHLCISVPVAVRNSAIPQNRGYVTIIAEPSPVPAKVFLRSLIIGHTPLVRNNIRSTADFDIPYIDDPRTEIRIVPLESKKHQSWETRLFLEAGKVYRFDPVLPPTQSSQAP